MSLVLPQAASERGQQAKTWIGTGLPPIPKALYEKILRWEYVDFAELCPRDPLDTAGSDPDPQRYIMLPGLEVARAKRKTIKDIYTWVSCFALYVSVLATKYPDRTLAMMAYLLTILRAQREYEDPAWRTSFREMRGSTGLKDWSKPDESIFTRVFTAGRSSYATIAPWQGTQQMTAPSLESVQESQGNRFRLKEDSQISAGTTMRVGASLPRASIVTFVTGAQDATQGMNVLPHPKRHVNGEVPPSGRPGRQLTSRSDQQ